MGIGFMDLSGSKGVHDLILHAVGTHRESALQLGNGLGGDAGTGEFVLFELHHVLLHLDHHRDDLVVELAGGLGGLGLLLGGGGKLVQLLPGDTPLVADVLGGGTHVVVIEGVPQSILDHGVHQLLVAHTGAPAGVHGGEGGGGHILGAAADDDVGVAGEDGPGSLDDALHAGAADHTHGVGGHGIGDAGLQLHLAGHVLALGGGEDAAEHQLVHLLRLHPGAGEHFLHHHGAHVGGGGVLQAAAEGADGGTTAVDNINFFHNMSLQKVDWGGSLLA